MLILNTNNPRLANMNENKINGRNLGVLRPFHSKLSSVPSISTIVSDSQKSACTLSKVAKYNECTKRSSPLHLRRGVSAQELSNQTLSKVSAGPR